MKEALSIILIIMSIALTTLIVMQSKGGDLSGLLGGGGDSTGVKQTRRGVEAMLHNFTVVLCASFFVVCLIAFFVWGIG